MADSAVCVETYQRAYPYQAKPMTSYGLEFSDACEKEIHRLRCSKVYILASRSLATKGGCLDVLKRAIGQNFLACYVGIGAHTPISDCLAAINEIQKLGGTDCIVTLGGGSVTDAGKLISFAIANEAYTEEDINTLWGGHSHNSKMREVLKVPTIPLLCIPTSLSGGEYSYIAGATESVTHAKRTFETKAYPTLVIQDPELCLQTPQNLWLSSGIRAVDHCVETLCSLLSNDHCDEQARNGLTKLITGLIRCKHNQADLEARHLCQLGVISAMSAVSHAVPLGASHAIGHQLGPLGVGHGETSCVLLPAVCKFNASRNANNLRQMAVKELLLNDEVVEKALGDRRVADLDLGDILDAIIRELGMPRTLKEVNVGWDQLDALASNSLQDVWIKTNAFPITEKSQVMEVLEMVIE